MDGVGLYGLGTLALSLESDVTSDLCVYHLHIRIKAQFSDVVKRGLRT